MRVLAPAPEAQQDSSAHQLRCAQEIVAILFRNTGLAAILPAPAVIVGAGNWISFDAGQPLGMQAALNLSDPAGSPSFVADIFNRRRIARSRSNPSLHLTNLDTGESLRGHVDAYYWASHPLAHAAEFFTRKTTEPSGLLSRLHT